jgi:hypothetical protein
MRQRLAVSGLVLLCAVLALVLLAGHRGSPRSSPTTVPVSPSPPLVLNAGHPSTSPSPMQPTAQAQTAARAFLASYLPVLYGRRDAAAIIDADAHVRESLAAASRPARAPADRHPRVTELVGEPQSNGSVLELATIADGVSTPYRIVFVIARLPDGWQVNQLANY